MRHLPLLTVCLLLGISAPSFGRPKSQSAGQPAAGRALLFGGFSKKNIVETAANHNGTLKFTSLRNKADTIHVVAFRVEFRKDTSTATTGNGRFGIIQGGEGGDKEETKYYDSDTVYKYDDLPHDSAYFDRQLKFVQDYYKTISRGKLQVDYSIFPPGPNEAYSLDTSMTGYGPGEKKPKETYAEHNDRINIRLLRFVRDAIRAADAATKDRSPFSSLHMDDRGNLRDSLGRRTVFLIIHAGASYLTDGLKDGLPDSPYDMVDAFISREFFGAYKDSLKLDTAGVTVKGAGGAPFLIDEIMMTCETANQDGLNFGIHGILINQLARQLGIPDLFNTAGGVTAIGAFCIMDFYGFLAGQGFVPPWPSAWVRAFMGWDSPIVIPMGRRTSMNIKAPCVAQPGDTTIALVPINDHEYYLIENRQRSLVGGRGIFHYDTTSAKKEFIDRTFPLNLDAIVTEKSALSREIMKVKNYDASLPASGALVWHVDEKVIRDRLAYDFLNADSAYRAVSLVEADGVNDLGIKFENAAAQSVYEAGGAEDVFPHYTEGRKTAAGKDSSFAVTGMGPWSKPSTHARDGGQTYLTLTFETPNAMGTEVSGVTLGEQLVRNYVDSTVKITVDWDFAVRGWPKHTVADSGERLFDPVVCDLYKGNSGREIVAISKKGRLYAWPAAQDTAQPLGWSDSAGVSVLASAVNPAMRNSNSAIPLDTFLTDTVRFMHLKNLNPRNPSRPFTFPTVVGERLFVPLLDSAIDVITGISRKSASEPFLLEGTIIPLAFRPSTYVCKLGGNCWAVGSSGGAVLCADSLDFGDSLTVMLAADTPAAVCAIAALAGEPGLFACIQQSSRLSIGSVKKSSPLASVQVKGGIPPFTIVTGDINHDDTGEIVICDSRKGIWVFRRDLAPALGWENAPKDWASSSSSTADAARASLPVNTSPVALADVDADGCLDIIAGGLSGLYAVNYKGNPITNWPSYLDNRYYRGNVDCSPAVVSAPSGAKSPLVVFSSPTGENETFEIDKIVSTNKKSGIIVFRRSDGTVDSTYATPTFIDSAIISGDSIIATVALYSGLIDAVDPSGARPLLAVGNNRLHSRWPLSIGAVGPGSTSPLLEVIDGDGSVDILAAAANGWVYRWKSRGDLTGSTLIWKQTGHDAGRSFAYGGKLGAMGDTSGKPIVFYSWPNPTDKVQTGGKNIVNFKFKFSAPAQNVRLDIFTYTGFHVFSKTGLSGSYPGWNSLDNISLANFGSGVYRCRMEAEVAGKRQSQFWKMAVVK